MSESALQDVSVVVLKDDSMLLVRHTNSKHIEGIYGLPGGKREEDEPFAETAQRELEEETGLTTTTDDLIPLSASFEADVAFKNGEVKRCVMHVLLCLRCQDELRGAAHEIPEWIPLAGVGKLHLLPNVQKAIREAKQIEVAL